MSLAEQYINLHKEYELKYGNKSLVLLQNGKFYEVYSITDDKTLNGKIIGPDCRHLEELTNVSMYRKGINKDRIVDFNNPICWGFPLISEEKYIPDLINDGYTLIIYLQKEENGKIERVFNKVISPGTYINDNDYKTLSNYINCIYIEEQTNKQNINYPLYCIGLSSIDVGTGKVYIHETLSRINDNDYCIDDTIRFNNGINPKEIILIKEDVKISDDELIKKLKLNDTFYKIYNFNNNYNKLAFQRNLLNKVYNNLSKSIYDIFDILNISDKIYIKKSLSHLLMYISDHYTNLITNLNEPVYYFQDNRLFLGNDAINQLNVINNEISLNDIINKPGTLMCKRFIKDLLISPLTDIKKLNEIYNNAELFKDNYNEIYKQLKNIYDLEKILRKIQLNNLNINHFYEFFNSLVNIKKLFEILNDDIKNKLNIDNNKINELNDFINYINENINIELSIKFNDKNIVNIFKKSFNNDNDELFKQIQNLFINLGNNQDIINIIYNKLNEIIGGTEKKPMLTLKNNNKKGYYFVITNKRFEILEKKFKEPIIINEIQLELNNFNIENKKTSKELYLPIHKDYDTTKIFLEIYDLINKYYLDFLNILLLKNDLIKYFINKIVEIDYYNTIMKTSKEYNYVKPIIEDNKDCFIDVVNLRHPIVERIINYEYIPHSLKLGIDNKGIMIYGLNSSGKSVLMKAIGLSIILAQSGFYVPANNFIFKPFKALYTRITGNDNIYKGLSSYMLEMNELNNIIKRANNETLIIGDEICRGTEHISGNIIVASTILKLLKLNSIFLFATHLHEIMDLPSIKNNSLVKAYHLHVKYENGKLIYDRILKEGIGEKIYGIIVAEQVIKDKEYNDIMTMIKKEVFNDKNINFSNYNKKIIMDKCEICGNKNNLNTHHIHFQKDCINGFSKENNSIKKNGINNLMVLCENCHRKIHNGEINIKYKILTSEGIELNQ